MPKALLLIQEKQLSSSQIQQLDALLKQLYRQHVGSDRLLTIWNRIPPGQAFTNYQDSQSSIATIECPNEFPQTQRISMLRALDEGWRAITGQKPDDLMLALVEKDMFAVVYEGNRKRLSPAGQLRFAWHILRSAVRSKSQGLPMQMNPNL